MELFKNEESERKGKKAPSNLITFAKKDKIESKVLSSLKVKESAQQSAPSLSWWMEKRKPLLKS